MKTMTLKEIHRDWMGLQKRHRMEIAGRVARYCIGHSIDEIAKELGYSNKWVQTQLDCAGIGVALGGSNVPLTGSTDNVAKEVPKLVSEYGPDVETQIVGRGGTDVQVTGKHAEQFEPYVDYYRNQGHAPAAATRLAKAEWAAEAAVEAGVITESVNKKNEKVNKILFPNQKEDDFGLDLKAHIARMKSFIRFLDEAKMRSLRRQSTRSVLAKIDEEWRFQMERIVDKAPKGTER